MPESSSEDGTFYYVMDLLEGLDAERLVNTFGPMPAERVIYLIRQVCHSLSEAESISLVHRDIKPANIFVCRYGEDYNFVKVLDFGIVKAIRQSGSPETARSVTELTGEHIVHGTPAFIAPEQLLMQHAHAVPDPPFTRTELPIRASRRDRARMSGEESTRSSADRA